jgi:single-stranded DNA-specific DHH superfamily exonuclease
MLTEKSINEIRKHLERAQNPVFFYDTDADGLASFVLLARWIGKGKGVIARNPRDSSEAYLRRVKELGADYVFVLDCPTISEDFVRGVEEINLPIVIIDHHDVPAIETEFYYNTFIESGKNEPVAYLCYKISNQKKDMWIAAIGCISDYYLPDFLDEFKENYPDLVNCAYENPFDIVYNCELGKLICIFNYGLKDTTTNVVKLSNFLLKVNFPSEVMEENSRTRSFLDRYEEIKNMIDKLFEKAKATMDEEKKVLFFTYGGNMSLSQHLSNKLVHAFPDFIIVVGYRNAGRIRFSLRGHFVNIRELVLESIENIPGATGGGHKHAAGAQMSEVDAEKFKINFLEKL